MAVTRSGPLVSSAGRNICLRSAPSRHPRAPSGAGPFMRRRPLSLCGAANPADDVKFLKSYFVYFTIFSPRLYRNGDICRFKYEIFKCGECLNSIECSFFRLFILRPSLGPAFRISLRMTGHARPRSLPSSSRSGGDSRDNLVPTAHTNFEFRRLYVFFEGLVISIRCRFKTFTYTNYNNAHLFYNFVCLVYDYRVFIRVSVLFSLRFNLNFTRIFASFTLQILF